MIISLQCIIICACVIKLWLYLIAPEICWFFWETQHMLILRHYWLLCAKNVKLCLIWNWKTQCNREKKVFPGKKSSLLRFTSVIACSDAWFSKLTHSHLKVGSVGFLPFTWMTADCKALQPWILCACVCARERLTWVKHIMQHYNMNGSGYGRDIMKANEKWPEKMSQKESGAVWGSSTNMSIRVRSTAVMCRLGQDSGGKWETYFGRE